MAYLTGTANDAQGIIYAIYNVAPTYGWEQIYDGADTQTGLTASYRFDKLLVLRNTKSGMYYYLGSVNSMNSAHVSSSIGYSGSGTARNNHPYHSSGGYSTTGNSYDHATYYGWAAMSGLYGPLAGYHLFITEDYVHLAVEVVTGSFTHMCFGTIDKAGPFNGGDYVTGTAWTYRYWYDYNKSSEMNSPTSYYNATLFDSYMNLGSPYYQDCNNARIRFDADGAVGNWLSFGGGACGFMRNDSLVWNTLGNRNPSTFNTMSPLLPSIITALRPSGGYAIMGTVKDVRAINITNYQPKDIITLGNDEWMVFPMIRKGTGTYREAVSGNLGIAYRKVA